MTFEDFIAARLGALTRYATVVTWDPHLAEDIIQNVLVRAQARWPRISRMDAPEQYVKRMVVNEFLSWRRRRAAQSIPVAGDTLAAVLPAGPDVIAQRDDRDAMMRLIAGLPPRQRAVIALRFYEDLSVAGILGCRAVTVRTHLMRALASLQNALPGTLVTTGDPT
ncbi:RNA polymerase sigma factor (sigma-70 family) [Actinoplanes lutulentus]|uniref:RNA polymerase sigma factor (Sigma-70 family) n=1 Tax=Actinoplanes lutulentus TaxID=1287878 RepID=A0A327Z9L1_9ACTN|nr:SigE family RNA polymerase sigma factor [Actinoplanes lutulentus]MBB2948254.1 RNA polymerase sigma factor (sigma-70 family) [Actinoplanes lutulentus]RAK31248.1 RNA polymerase sigma factor (sigma-70 family) [Actinoplanes lutulentus]